MPRVVDYPRKSLSQSLELAAAVDALGGSASEDMAADRMGRKGTGSGAFAALVGAAVKFGLVDNRKALLSITPRYRDYKLAYDEEQRVQALRGAFVNVPLFQRICERFAGKAVPVDILDKLLIREFDVPEAIASRVSEYFLDGAQLAGLLGDGGVLLMQSAQAAAAPPSTQSTSGVKFAEAVAEVAPTSAAHYVVRVTGPGISSSVEIFGEEDLIIVDAVLKRIRRSLQNAVTS